jgi:hypothetical protein
MVGSFVQKSIESLRREAARPKHAFLISIRRVPLPDSKSGASFGFVAQVLDMETREVVHETLPQPEELDARVIAGLWIERQEASE